MLEAPRPATVYDFFGRFKDKATEERFLTATWPEDRRALFAVAVVAASIYAISFFFDVAAFSAEPALLLVTLTIRAIVITATIAFAFFIRQRHDYVPIGFAVLFQELLIIGGYLVIANMLADFIDLQIAALAIVLVFVWFFVPIHPYFSLASTGLLMAGAIFLQVRYASHGGTGVFLMSLLYSGVLVMGFISTRSRDQLRREKFLDQQKLVTANRELRKEIEIREVAESLEAQSKEKFEGLFQASPMPLALSDRETGDLLAVNDAFEDLVGYPKQEIIGRDHKDFVLIDDAYIELDRHISEKPGAVSADILVKRADGTKRECTITSVRFDQGTEGEGQILTGLYDITDRKEFERDLVAARLAAERAQKAQSEFLATMSHEIRTPLNAMLGFLQVVELDTISDSVRSNLGLARQSGEHLLTLISDILDLSRLASGKIELEPIDVNCHDLANGMIEMFRASAAQKEIEIRSEVTLPRPMFRFDELRVRQILFNLVGNAVKFTANGHVVLRVSEADRSTTDAPWLKMEVFDTGIGVDPEKAEHIFQEFTQADNSVTRQFGGTGLGLAISKKLVDAMGGLINVRKNSPTGSVFWFEIPAHATESDAGTSHIAPAKMPDPGASSGHGRVLVAEDNPMNQRVIGAFLGSLGVDYEIVENGQIAIERLCEDDFQIVLMDIQMPVLDGMSAIRFIRSGATPKTDIPIVVLTANAMAGDRDSYIAAGANDYLAKPITLNDLRSVLDRFLLIAQTPEKNAAAD